jgi:hypothetical protein
MGTAGGRRLTAALAAAVLSGACGGGSSTSSSPLVTTTLQHYTSFLTATPPLVDPLVFVPDPQAPGGAGAQGIHHAAGVTPFILEPANAPGVMPLRNADGVPIGQTVLGWLASTGKVTYSCSDGRASLHSQLQDLKPGGTYSVFAIHGSGGSASYTPWGTGTSNVFTAALTGMADRTDRVDGCLDNGHRRAGVAIVYDSDGRGHGTSIGNLGLNAHIQLAAYL